MAEKESSFSEIFGYVIASIVLIKRNFKPFALLGIFFIILSLLLTPPEDKVYAEMDSRQSLLIMGTAIISLITYTMLIIAVSRHVERSENFSMNNMINDINEGFFPLFQAIIIKFFIITLGFICFIIPGIILSLRYSLIEYFVIFEKQSFQQAKANSIRCMQGYKLPLFLIFFVTAIAEILLIVLTDFLLFGTMYGSEPHLLTEVISSITSFIYTLASILTLYIFWKKKRHIAYQQPDSLDQI